MLNQRVFSFLLLLVDNQFLMPFAQTVRVNELTSFAINCKGVNNLEVA